MSQTVIQSHHICYPSDKHPEQEEVVRVRKCEHLILTKIQWYCKSRVSRGFLKALKVFVVLNEDRAEDV